MYTLGYSFRPWTNPKSIADGPSILSYIRETAREYDVEKHIRFGHRAIAAEWDSERATWRVQVERDGETVTILCNFLFMCSGYYNYARAYTPEFEGSEDFPGQVFHAQHWPGELDYQGRKVMVIGSGATAVTLVPELAREAASTIMLQRSPTYIASVPSRDKLANSLRKWLPDMAVYRLTRLKRVLFQLYIYKLSRRRPERVKAYLLKLVRDELGPEYDVEKHFTPRYNPWDQRLCAVPDGDLFAAIREGRAEVVTDQIARFTPGGIALQSGRELEADIIVLATGLNLQFMSDLALTVDGERIDPAQQFVYRGTMLSNVPNLALSFGYTNSSWTLKSDLTAEYVCRMLNHMRKSGCRKVMAKLREGEAEEEPMLDFTSGYVLRAADQFPKQGRQPPWRVYQNYFLDMISLRFSKLSDQALEFSK
jgi:cation diffusion facilitator CzcD-associated flavoprotein CzcO